MLLFIAAEIGVAVFGLASRGIFYDWMYSAARRPALEPSVGATLVFATLLWPTFWMGVPLPVLSRAIGPQIGDAAGVWGIALRPEHARCRGRSICHHLAAFPRIGLDGSLIAVWLNVSAAARGPAARLHAWSDRVTHGGQGACPPLRP